MIALTLTILMAGIAMNSADVPEFVWVEGESPAFANFEFKTGGWGNIDYLSESSWLHFTIDANEVEKVVPEEGLLIRYDFDLSASGEYEVWGRLGYEFIRSVFEWRIDNGDWHEVDPFIHLSTDLMEIQTWNEVAWVRMGKMQLDGGRHSLTTRHRIRYRENEGRREPDRLIYAADAFCIYPGEFRPNGKHKPNADWQTERDRQAAEHVFSLPTDAPDGDRAEIPLDGIWQIARYDESGLVEGRTLPIESTPDANTLHWSSIPVPGDRDSLRPDLKFCHRYFYRTRVYVPESYRGRSFLLDFVETSMLTTVFVNGRRMAFHDAPLTGFLADVTDAIKVGRENEIWVGIKDAYYAIEPNEEKPNTRYWFNIPHEHMNSNQGVTMRFDYPMKGHTRNGITDRVSFIATGKVYVESVYVIPSVKRKDITLEIELRSNSDEAVAVEIGNEIIPLDGGKAEKVFRPHQVEIPPRSKKTVELKEDWGNPRLWFPDDPYQYQVITRLQIGGEIVDTKRTKFGFREWSIEGTRFALNGIPWQFRANLDYYSAGVGEAEEAVEWWRKSGQNMFRLRFQEKWGGMTQNEVLDFFDAHGVPVRRTCSTFDGQHASYGLVEYVERDGERVKVPRSNLFENWRKQVAARVRQQRNHPCIFIWELDNEIIYINTRNFGNLDVVEPEFTKAAELIRKLDRQGRGVMVAGGRALMNQSLPVNGCHYEESATRDYPDMAYGLGGWTAQTRQQPWPMALDRPIFLGETFYARGWNPGRFAAIGGEVCFLGRAETADACGLFAKMLSEGYRWQHLGAFHYWFARYGTAHYNSWQPVVALCREWNWTFGGGTEVERTIKILNDTRYDDPITFRWEFTLDGESIAHDTCTYSIAPGLDQTLVVRLNVPDVDSRKRGKFLLACYRNGREIWRDEKPLSVIDPNGADVPQVSEGDIVVWDPHGAVADRLKSRGIDFREIGDINALPDDFRVLIVGHDAVTPQMSTDQFWLNLAARGKRILVLDQANPLHYQAVPADFEVTDYVGRIAFAENPDHPIFDGLIQDDFFTWSGDHVVYRNVYRKASTGAKSLAQCDDFLACSAIAECTVDEGLMLLCQMVVGEKLPTDPVAQRLFDNMLNYALRYELVKNRTAVVLPKDDPRMRMLSRSGLEFLTVDSPLEAIDKEQADIAIIDGSPENLALLSRNMSRVDDFTQNGGWLILWNVTPGGLSDFNRIVGYDHVIRPFRREKVSLPAIRDPLTSGLSQRDVVLYSGERIFGWTRDEYVVDDLFTWVVDLDEIAPFAEGNGIEGTGSIVNGFTSTEAWKYIYYMPMREDGSPPTVTLELPREEVITSFSIVPNAHYWLMRKIKLVFDDDESTAQTVELAAYDSEDNPRQDFELEPVKARKITLVPVSWDASQKRAILGIDNIWIKVKRPDDFRDRVKGLLNIGALVKYPRGGGGVILNQLNVKDQEPVPVNYQKKMTLVSTILRNLNAVFAGEKKLMPGEGLRYDPISLEGVCNLYITASRGWHDSKYDFRHLPLGRQRFAGVVYEIRDFRTSPLESAVTLQGLGRDTPRSREIPVNKKADALFFLHTFHRKREWRPRRETDNPPIIWHYRVNYADGSSIDVPILYGIHADHWVSESPKGLRGAALAWSAPFPTDPSRSAVIYQFQWDNPHRDKMIASVTMAYDDEVGNRYGTPILFGISAATK